MASVYLKDIVVEYPTNAASRATIQLPDKKTRIGGNILFGKDMSVRALNNISFELKDGDRLGLLGRNGAGKTTLLKTLAGILPPIQGEIRIEGLISPLTSIMLGLDGEATGYENIQIRGRLMGLSEEQITEYVPEISEFTELGEYLHLPIKTYSSGMRMRLSLAASTAFKPDILLLDEWLGTGDLEFREKAAKRLRKLIFESGIFVFASHSRDMHRRLSNKGAVIDKGELLFLGGIEEAFLFQDDYYKQMDAAEDAAPPAPD